MGRALGCGQCRLFLDEASSAVMLHLRAQSRLDLARCRRETDLLPALEAVADEAAKARATAVDAYKTHRAEHE
ncbi:MAG TPA: hypothetical protein VG456_00820 [Candidatus Sulfopaludibacter sp.]|nr:hypothetical protein [Candidatus Sulfopaludibacter sp.]